MTYVIVKQYRDENYGFYNNKGFPSTLNGNTRQFTERKKAENVADRLYRYHIGFQLEVVTFNEACRIEEDQQKEADHDYGLAGMEDF